MNQDQFWLTAEQFAKIAPHPPTDKRGKTRVDGRRVISGIVHVLKSGGRWIDAPPEYGPRKTLYNRYVRWTGKGVWVRLFEASAQADGPHGEVLIDCSAVKAHPSASGGKGGGEIRLSLTRRADDENPRLDRRRMPSSRLHADWRQCYRLHGGHDHFSLKVCGTGRHGTGCSTLNYQMDVQ